MSLLWLILRRLFIPLISPPPGCKPLHLRARSKLLTKLYKPRAYNRNFTVFCLHRALYELHTWKLFDHGKIFAHGKIKSGRKSLGKKKKKRQTLRRKKRYHSVKKRKKFLCESDWYWRSATYAGV